MDIPTNVSMPTFSVCFRYADILDIEGLRKKGASVPDVNYANIDESISLIQSIVTVQVLLDFTPSVETVITDCVFRSPGEYNIEFLNAEQCKQKFTTDKFYVQSYVCYRLEPTIDRSDSSSLGTNWSYDYQTTASALVYPNMAYTVGFNLSAFDDCPTIIPIVHQRGSLPTESIYFAPELRRFDSTQRYTKERINYFYLTYKELSNKRLPSPYPSDCSSYEGSSQSKCFKDCLVDMTLKEWNLIPFTEIIKSTEGFPLTNKLVSTLYFNDSTFESKLIKLGSQCSEKCKQPNCEEVLYLTSTNSRGRDDDSLSFRINLPASPNYFITFQPMMLFYEYATYILSCFGTWIGLTMYQYNPLELYYSLRKYQEKRRTSRLMSDIQTSPVKTSPRTSRRQPHYASTYIASGRSRNWFANQDHQLVDNYWTSLEIEGLQLKIKLLREEISSCRLSNNLR